MAAHYAPQMQSPSVESVQIAHGLFQTARGPFSPCSSTASATNARGYDLGDPSLPRQPDGLIARIPTGGP
eukprot:6502861-Pyramimonas_sp.AAC.1